MFVLMIKMFEDREPIGVYDSQEAAQKAADGLNKSNKAPCYFYVKHVYFNKYDLRLAW